MANGTPQHQGGVKRAEVLSDKRKAEIAKEAANQRWHPKPDDKKSPKK